MSNEMLSCNLCDASVYVNFQVYLNPDIFTINDSLLGNLLGVHTCVTMYELLATKND